MHQVTLLVRHLSEGRLVGLYVRDDLKLPFVPFVGMQFKQGISTWLWETKTGELMPKVEAVTYDLDENLFVCVFTVAESLNASFWTRVDEEDLDQSIYLPYFERRF